MPPISLVDPELRRNITLNDSPLLRRFPLLLPPLRLLMLSKMLDVLRMVQILLLNIIPTMVLLPMMDLILILIIAMMSRSESKIRQLDAVVGALLPFMQRNDAVVVGVVKLEDGLDCGVFLLFGDGGGGGVRETVRPPDVVLRPDSCGVVVVEGEENAGVEGGDVMLLWMWD